MRKPDSNKPAPSRERPDAGPETPVGRWRGLWPFPKPVEALLAALLPALLAGFHLTALIYFLNPHIEPALRGFSEGTLRLAALLAPFALAAHWLGTRLKNARVRRLVPWSLTVVLFAAALGDWVHASHYSFYLPPGINANLIRSALWLSLASILSFYTALLHTVHHRRYGARSLILLTAVGLGSLYVVVDRRASYRPLVVAAAPFARPQAVPAPHLLVVGLQGATLDVLLPLARQGRLPFFATLFDDGSYARLESFPPIRRLGLWASLTTGKLPFRHGLAGPTFIDAPWLGPPGELRLLPLGFFALGLDRLLGVHRPVERRDRRVRTVLEILGQLDRSVAVVGAPGPLLSGSPGQIELPDALFYGDRAAAAALPPALAGRVELLRGGLAIAAPGGTKEATGAGPGSALDETLAAARAQDGWRAAVAASLLVDSPSPSILFVELPGLLDVELLTLGGFHAAEMSGSRSDADRRAASALTDYIAFLDATLTALWEKLPEPRLLALVSAYGVAPPEGVRRLVGELRRSRRTAGTLAGSPDGVLILRGEGVRRGEGLATARIVDLVPTLLYVERLPIARDLDGRVLTEAFEPALLQGVPLTFLPTYEDPRPPNGH